MHLSRECALVAASPTAPADERAGVRTYFGSVSPALFAQLSHVCGSGERTLAQPTPLSPDWQRLSTFGRSREPCARIAALTSASPRCVTATGARSEDPRPRH